MRSRRALLHWVLRFCAAERSSRARRRGRSRGSAPKVSFSAFTCAASLFGATIGAGVEAKITDQITARTEYRFTNYQTQTFDLDSGARDRGFKEHQVSVGLGMRF